MNERNFNLASLVNVFLINNKEVEKVDDFSVLLENKDGTTEEIETNKEKLLDTLINVFNTNVETLKKIEIYYIKENIKKVLNGITIF